MRKQKIKKLKLSTEKKRAWNNFSKYIRLRDAIKTTKTKIIAECYTCGKQYPINGIGCLQAGHFIPGRGNSELIDEVGVHAQCYNCNVNLRGNWVEFERHLLKDYGQKEVDRLKANKGKVIQHKAFEWNEIAKEYATKYTKLLEG